jgi:hypothetical protein
MAGYFIFGLIVWQDFRPFERPAFLLSEKQDFFTF